MGITVILNYWAAKLYACLSQHLTARRITALVAYAGVCNACEVVSVTYQQGHALDQHSLSSSSTTH